MRRLRSLRRNLYRWFVRPIGLVLGRLLGLVPALFAGGGVFLVAAGLFYYLQPAAAAPVASATPAPSQSVAMYSLPPLVSIAPSGSSAPVAAVATRVVVPALSIDLPVVTSPPNEQFPLCNAAEYLVLGKPLAYPGLPQATYLYAHARTNMFLPLLTQSMINNGAALIGMWVEVYTDNNQRHVYEITQVLRHVSGSAALVAPAADKTDQLWLQTSEGPYESSTKLQVVAEPIGVLGATAAESHPAGKGNVCPDAPICKTSTATGCRR
ncbi:MAG: hypothetical protein ACHQ01_02275 [Candidatus Limnocylindrales bacterium]